MSCQVYFLSNLLSPEVGRVRGISCSFACLSVERPAGMQANRRLKMVFSIN